MKLRFTALLTVMVLTWSFLLATPVAADTSSTSEVQVATQDGATYLTTTTISTTSSPLVPKATAVPVGRNFVNLPAGFFPSANALVNQIFRIIMVISVILVFAYLVIGGIQYITSGGEKAKTEAARNKIVSAIVGLIIVASSYAILTIVLNFIGYRDINGFIDIGTPGPTVTTPVTPTPFVTPLPTPSPTPTPTPTSALQKLLQ